jgi:putative transposase
MKSINYPQNNIGFNLAEKLKVNPFGQIQIKKHREVKGTIKTMALKREASGKWFAIFTVEERQELSEQNFGAAIGIDLGLMNFAAISNGEFIQNPRHLRRYGKKLAFFQRRLSRKMGHSNKRLIAKLSVARMHEKVHNVRQDFLHKLSSRLVKNHSIIALENLASQEMAEHNFGKSINDAGWNMFANMIAYKAESAGCKVVFVDPKDTTKECGSCGTKTDKALGERIHDCPSCGLRIDRDLNAALVILKRATGGTPGSNASGDEPRGLSLKEDATRFSGW